MAEPIWNVRTSVVELVAASSPEQAIERLHDHLARMGLEVYIDATAGYTPAAFESEPLEADTETRLRRFWRRTR